MVKRSEYALKLFLKCIWNPFLGLFVAAKFYLRTTAHKEPQVYLKLSSAGFEVLQVWLRTSVSAFPGHCSHVLLRKPVISCTCQPPHSNLFKNTIKAVTCQLSRVAKGAPVPQPNYLTRHRNSARLTCTHNPRSISASNC